MSDYCLPLSLEYQSSVSARRIQLEINGGKPDASFWHYVDGTSAVAIALLLMLAIFVAARSKQEFFACLYFVSLIQWCRWVYNFGSRKRKEVRDWLNTNPDDITKLELTKAGFVEHDLGIESFAPWSAMKWYVMKEDALCICLSNSLCASIPRDTLKPENVTLEIIEKILLDHGISRRA